MWQRLRAWFVPQEPLEAPPPPPAGRVISFPEPPPAPRTPEQMATVRRHRAKRQRAYVVTQINVVGG